MKRMPLLILGKRQSGKTTALLNFVKTNPCPVIVSHKAMGRRFKEEGMKVISSLCLPVRGIKEVVIDEFSRCNLLDLEHVQILALTDDINNFVNIMRTLRLMDYPIQEFKRGE